MAGELGRGSLLVVIVSFCLLKTAYTAAVDPTYTIVAPKLFRPSSNYNVTATCSNINSDVTVTVSIQMQDNTTLVEGQAVLSNGVPRILSLVIPAEVPETSYVLAVKGTGGHVFNDSKTISVNRKTLSIFVQTDKPMYKPGQTVLLRAIIVYSNLKPYQGLMDIEIYDLAGNKIVQWLKQKNDSGVVSQSLVLSDQTPLGDWQIVVTAQGNSLKKTFQVAEYVLPKFKTSVILPSFYLVNANRRDLQEDLKITVIAEYTYGQPVKGRANVTIQITPYGSWDQTNYTKKSVDVQLVDGKADISLKIKDLLELVPISQYWYGSNTPDAWNFLPYRSLLVVADVNETVTGKVLSGNSTVDCKMQKYELTFLSFTPDNYKPGLLYTAYMQLAKPDGTGPDLKDIKQSNGEYAAVLVQLTLSYPSQNDRYGNPVYSSSTSEEFNVTVDPSGLMSFTTSFQNNVTSVNIQATFYVEPTNSTIYAYKTISVFKTRDNQSIQIFFDSPDGVIKSSQQVTFNVSSNEPFAVFQYALLSKGSIQLSGSISESPSTKHSFSLWITKDLAMKLAPSVRVLVFLMNVNGEIIADSIELNVNDVFANEVNLSFDVNSTTPGQNVSLIVKASSNSAVFLLALDQSILLLKQGNDITKEMVTSDLKNYDSTSSNVVYPMFMDDVVRGKRSIWFPYFNGGQDSATIFDNAGVEIISNAFVNRYVYRYPYYEMGAPGAPGVAASGPQGAPVDDGRSPEKSNTDAPSPQASSEKTRMNFPETWLWTDAVTGSDGKVTIKTCSQDTITSWIASAFAVSQTDGLGVAPVNAKLTVFKPFFISPSLPFSVIRGEEFALQVTVFNYLSSSLNVVVTLEDSNYFTTKGERSVATEVDSNDAKSVYFWIIPRSLGQIPISIKGISPVAGDSVIVNLLVKPEGVPQQYSTSVFFQLQSTGSTFNTTLEVSLPPPGVLVNGSEYVEVTVIGDIMGPSVKGLDALLQMPYGCGEQNMLTFAPDVYICDYLNVSDQLTSEIKSKVLGFMNAGYQRELTYQRTADGSFSAFGDSDECGSIWLSAFVIKCFHQSKGYIPVDDSKIARTMQWIIGNQSPNGSFEEPPNGRVIHVDMQGGSSKGLPLTAYIFISLLENKDNSHVDASNLTQSIASTLSYLENNLESASSDPYALAILSYAFAKAKSPKVYEALKKLDALAKVEAGTKHWEKPDADSSSSETRMWQPPYLQAKAVNIEITSYVLLTWCEMKNLSASLPIAKWIVGQRNSNGGFSSTQDTVVALEALTAFAAMILGPSGERDVLVSVATDLIQHNFLPIKSETSILLQSYQLPSNSTHVYVTATGKGSALVQLNAQYNVYKTEEVSGIHLNVTSTQNGKEINTEACSRWLKKEGSGMVVMEINQLTGFQPSNVDDLKEQSKGFIKRVETPDGKVVLYFDELPSKELCVNLISEKVYPVANVQDASVKVFPYYNPSAAQIQLYGAPQALGQNSACSECPQCCGDVSATVTEKPTSKMSGTLEPSDVSATAEKPTNKMSGTLEPSMLFVLTVLVFIQLCFIKL